MHDSSEEDIIIIYLVHHRCAFGRLTSGVATAAAALFAITSAKSARSSPTLFPLSRPNCRMESS